MVVVWALLACSAQAQQTFASRYTNTAVAGDIVLIGNVTLHCPVSDTNCAAARNGGAGINNNFAMTSVDVDSDATTTSSSSAGLSLLSGSSVLFARLYWSGVSAAAGRANVLFKVPGGSYQTLTGTVAAIGSTYQASADVTAQVSAAGNGTYTVANLVTGATSGNWGGWTLVVAFKNASLPTRNLAVFDGLQSANNTASPVDIAVSGFLTPSTGAVNSTIGVVAYDGDKGSKEGPSGAPSLLFGPTAASLSGVFNSLNPQDDVFNSTISNKGVNVPATTDLTVRNPSYSNTLGLDIDTFTPNTALPNGSTSAVVRVIGSSGDVIYPGIITLTTDIFVPNIKDSLTKSVTDLDGGALLPGDTLEYQLYLKNTGNDGALNLVLTDALPAEVTYVPGTVQVTAGANLGSKTDASNDDQAEYVAASRTVKVRLGTGASATAGGKLLPGEEARVVFRAVVNAGTASGTVINNSGSAAYNQQTLGTAVTDLSDSDPNTPGDQPASVTVATPDLSLTKTHTGSFVAGGTGSFTLRVSNASTLGSAATAPSGGTVTVTDTLPSGLSATALSGPGWTCSLSPLRCTRSDALAAGNSYPDLTLTVQIGSGVSGNLTNTASVSGGGESAAATSNNGASDTVNVLAVLPASFTLAKTVRNITAGAGTSTSNTAKPGEVLEYCVTYTNSGGRSGPFQLQDSIPAPTQALTSAYGSGLGVSYTSGGTTSLLTSVADSDAASLDASTLLFSLPNVPQSGSGAVCFQVKVP